MNELDNAIWYDIFCAHESGGCYRLPPESYADLVASFNHDDRACTVPDIYGFEITFTLAYITSIRKSTPEARARWDELNTDGKESWE